MAASASAPVLLEDPEEVLTSLAELFAEESAPSSAAALHGRGLLRKKTSPGNTTYAVWGSKPKPRHGTRHAPSGGMASLLPYRQFGLPRKSTAGIMPTMWRGECTIPESAQKAEPEVLAMNVHLIEMYNDLTVEYGLIQSEPSGKGDKKTIRDLRTKGAVMRQSIRDVGGCPLMEPILYWKSTYPKAFI